MVTHLLIGWATFAVWPMHFGWGEFVFAPAVLCIIHLLKLHCHSIYTSIWQMLFNLTPNRHRQLKETSGTDTRHRGRFIFIGHEKVCQPERTTCNSNVS